MKDKVETLDNIKRTIYFFGSIFISVYLIGNFFLSDNPQTTNILSISLIIYFLVSLFLLKNIVFMRYHEKINIVLISTYLIGSFYKSINEEFLQLDIQSLGDFIIWMPIYIIYLFLVLGKKYGLIVSLFVLSFNLIIGFPYFNDVTGQQMDSIIQYYIANLIYILVIYSFQYIVSTHAEFHALKKNAYYDALTEIPNRRKCTMVFEKLIYDTQNDSSSFAVIFLDIDHFKRINDKYGHDTGDIVLKEFASLITKHPSKNEFVGRWGGEEFIIFSKTSLQDAFIEAERLRRMIENEIFTTVNSVTSSIGVASFSKGDTVDSLLKRADLALYEAKKLGRNRVVKNELKS
ncbi:GGDEF domain-containing protein [Metabacillus litoralis]|uniref:GGDEF domain-containing protein n=1 Tax=Metabacillus litoralis TaxID=152268 RepID=UPI001CFE3646|nr:GGDEF domain-containing protein [Metabacillus litoralis]